MPKIEQLDWSKLKPATIENSRDFGTRNFVTYHYKEPSKKSKHGAIKITKPPKTKNKAKKVKPIDKTLWRENFDQMQHLRNISREN